jgi:hypothetical protein
MLEPEDGTQLAEYQLISFWLGGNSGSVDIAIRLPKAPTI